MTAVTKTPPHVRSVGMTAGAVAGMAVALCGSVPIGGAACVFLLLAGALAWGWPRLLDLPSPRGTSGVLAATGVALAAILLLSDAGTRTRWAGAVLCVGLIGSFLHQLLRQDGRPRLVVSLAGTALGLGVLGAGSYLIAANDEPGGRRLLFAAGIAVAVSSLVDGVAKAASSTRLFGLVQVALGGLVGLVASVAGGGVWQTVLTGALSGLLSWACLRTVVSHATSAHKRAQVAAGCAGALVCCFVPYAVGALT